MPGLNFALAGLHAASAVYVLVLLPAWLLPGSAWWALSLLPIVALHNPLWSLIHETVHGAFHPDAGVNTRVGRALALWFGSPWRILAIGHLLHHRHNRTPLDRVEVYVPAQCSKLRAALGYYPQLMFGLYLSQVASPLAFVLPRTLLERAHRRFLAANSYSGQAAAALLEPAAIAEVRRDGALIWGLFLASAWLYGLQAWMLLAFLSTRAVCISFLDYVYHYGTPLGERMHAYNLRLPRVLAALLLNFNCHGEHHRNPRLPWAALRAAFAASGRDWDTTYGRAALRQLRGPIAISALPQWAPNHATLPGSQQVSMRASVMPS
jgi:fatty acid desaturase